VRPAVRGCWLRQAAPAGTATADSVADCGRPCGRPCEAARERGHVPRPGDHSPENSRVGLAGRIMLFLHCALLAAAGEPPAGYAAMHAHTMSDGDCHLAQCGNLDGQLEQGGGKTCTEHAAGNAKCVADASASCDADPHCWSFIVPVVGRSGNNWGTYRAGLGNVAPNPDWTTYYKRPPQFFGCDQCAKQPPISNPPSGYEKHYTRHCPTLGSAWKLGSSVKILCGGPAPLGWGWPFLFVLGLCGGAYVGGGVALGRLRGRGRGGGEGLPALAAHPHWGTWLALLSLCADGVAFARATRTGRGRLGAEDRGRSEHREKLLGGGSGQHGTGARGCGLDGSSRKTKTKKAKKQKKSSAGAGAGAGAGRRDHGAGGGAGRRDHLHGNQSSLAVDGGGVAAAAPAREWAPTRTGHLAVGARETGVKVVA
jgi:hypothetical protein